MFLEKFCGGKKAQSKTKCVPTYLVVSGLLKTESEKIIFLKRRNKDIKIISWPEQYQYSMSVVSTSTLVLQSGTVVSVRPPSFYIDIKVK